MEEVGRVLNNLDGAVVTGCDLNTSSDDMEYLMQHCEYHLVIFKLKYCMILCHIFYKYILAGNTCLQHEKI